MIFLGFLIALRSRLRKLAVTRVELYMDWKTFLVLLVLVLVGGTCQVGKMKIEMAGVKTIIKAADESSEARHKRGMERREAKRSADSLHLRTLQDSVRAVEKAGGNNNSFR
ncbi:MAG TPA: hypothetical protein VD993_01710 [Chitinophagaceae bacterium]|nr:hypothetical protein [Chitinophagaceae bacterium]